MKRNSTMALAFGGILAAVAVAIMTLLGFLGIATYVCPMLCLLLCAMVNKLCGSRIGWAWYGAVSLLSLLFASDKEAALVFVALGYYPILQKWFERRRLSALWKAAYFNLSTVLLYAVILHLLGLEEIIGEFSELGSLGLFILLLLGNVTFFLVDMLLHRMEKRRCE